MIVSIFLQKASLIVGGCFPVIVIKVCDGDKMLKINDSKTGEVGELNKI